MTPRLIRCRRTLGIVLHMITPSSPTIGYEMKRSRCNRMVMAEKMRLEDGMDIESNNAIDHSRIETL